MSHYNVPLSLLDKKEFSHLILQHCEAGILTPFCKLQSELRQAERFAKAMLLERDRVMIHIQIWPQSLTS